MSATEAEHGQSHGARAACRQRVAQLAAALALAVAAVAAARSAGTGDAAAAAIEPVFDCYAANSAWGLAYSGKVVGRDGRIWSYGRRGMTLPAPVREGDRNFLRETDLAAKFAGSQPSGSVDGNALADRIALIDRAATGRVERHDTGVRDAGTSTCHAYEHDAAKRRYRDVELGSDGGVGDVRVVNDSAEAKALLDWLRSIGVAR